MHFDLKKPCDNCPFLKKGGIRLTQGRIQQIAGYMLDSQGATFPCHKTTIDTDEDGRAATPKSKHCAGALIFAEKNDNANQMMRIAERLGIYKPQELMADQAIVDLVFDDVDDMLAVNEEAEGGQRRGRGKKR
jgi:hypothetical protein